MLGTSQGLGPTNVLDEGLPFGSSEEQSEGLCYHHFSHGKEGVGVGVGVAGITPMI